MQEITHEQSLEHFSDQIAYALKNYRPHGIQQTNIKNIIIGGLGGSGIGGRIARNYFSTICPLPVEVYSDYRLPAYAGKDTLVMLSSYSGETEETLQMFEEASQRGCRMLCITSGGKLAAMAAAGGITTYMVEQGFQPRQALGYSLTYNLLVLAEMCGYDITKEMQALTAIYQSGEYRDTAADMLSNHQVDIHHKFVVVSDATYEAVGMRFCQQIQENAKAEAFINVLPEANHNVFETYYSKLPCNFIFIYNNENTRVSARFGYLTALLRKYGNTVYSMPVADGSLHHIFATIYTTDWFSILLSNKRGVNNMTVPNIMDLKQFLASH